jgi:Uma2 family endonuclease
MSTSVEDFERFCDLPENADRLFEFIGGEIVEVMSRPYASSLVVSVNMYLHQYVDSRKLGYITGKKGGYAISGERYQPDLAFISRLRQPQLPRFGYVPNAPDLVVKVDSPADTAFGRDLRIKTLNYLAAGTHIWILVPDQQVVEVYIPGQPVKIIGIDGTLDGGDVLPGFTLAVKDIFPDEKKA